MQLKKIKFHQVGDCQHTQYFCPDLKVIGCYTLEVSCWLSDKSHIKS